MPIIVPKDFLELIDLIKNNKLTESDISEEDLDILSNIILLYQNDWMREKFMQI